MLDEIIKRKNLDLYLIDEIEKISASKYYKKIIDELKNDSENFNNFRALKKGLVLHNDEINEIANYRFQDSATYDTFKRVEKDKSVLRNKLHVKMIIDAVGECVKDAYQLAKYREKGRQNANFENIKETLARIERELMIARDDRKHINNVLTRNQNFDIGERTRLAPSPAAAQYANSQRLQQSPSRKRTRTSVTCDNEDQKPAKHSRLQRQLESSSPRVSESSSAPTTTHHQLGLYRFVSKEKCQSIYAANPLSGKFFQIYLAELFSDAELLCPLKTIPDVKKQEFLNVISHIFGTSKTWENRFIQEMSKLRSKKRQEVFGAIGKSKGYGITSSGATFFFKSSNGMCFKNRDCDPSEKLQTTKIGKVAVPTNCGDFEYILLIEKPGFFSKFQKLYSDGRIEKL
uniref:Uncharacterized protein n=1 Tax=Panagrolaimus superbus TaxID=310955 RepID=A0A914YNX4_9BILA